ncbi:ROK family protein [Paenibacillus physcomitrellae]|uniref:Glucokinase n=1 Tax=Paenibacillus physcomitrellae TaxID=1619311 RepID=A0ABQ1FMW7_9BACL|nr:ROK family protein [Paenibacillus physcomitrellae]GGA20191.1 glucokinase [Paenibacillus physcomitrellae]
MSAYTVGIDLGGTNIKTAVFDGNGRIVRERSDQTDAKKGPSYVINKIKHIVRQMLKELEAADTNVACMGLGIPGLLDPKEGLSIFSPNFPGWENIHVVNEMSGEFSFPVYIDNDVRVNLYGEWYFGAGKGFSNIVLITLGTGLGSGIVVDGNVLYGATASAGEIGHMNMYREGRPCRCGSSGCLGRYVSAVGMVSTFTERLEQGKTSIVQSWVGSSHQKITARMISDAYDLADDLAMEVMHETGRILGFGLSNAINLFNPELVIIGGGMAAAGERLLRTVRDTVNQHSLQLSSQACKVVQAQLGEKAGVYGADAYAKRRLSAGS